LYYGYIIPEQNAAISKQEPTKTLQIPVRQLEEEPPTVPTQAPPIEDPMKASIEAYAISVDIGGMSLGEMLENATAKIEAAREVLGKEACMQTIYQPHKAAECGDGVLYDMAMLYEYCGRGSPAVDGFFPSRMEQQFGITDVAQLRLAQDDQKLKLVQAAIIKTECADLIEDLLNVPRMPEEAAGDVDFHLKGLLKHSIRNVPNYRIHAALLGDTRAARWVVDDWNTTAYQLVNDAEIEKVVKSRAGTVDGHRLAYQWEVTRPPVIGKYKNDHINVEGGEERIITAATHLLVFRSLSPNFYEQAADTRWMHLDEAAFLEGLDPNIMTLVFDKANELSSEI
jgi:hypothetical protein